MEEERQEVIGGDQREGIMVLIEYQAMPSFRDVAQDGWLCTFTI